MAEQGLVDEHGAHHVESGLRMCRQVQRRHADGARGDSARPVLVRLVTLLSPAYLGPLLGQVVRGGEEKQQQLLAADFPIARMFREMSSWAHLPAESDEAASRKEVDP